MQDDLIEIENPKPFDYVGAKFTIEGWVHLSWFENDNGGLDWRMFVDYLALNAQVFMGTAPSPKLDDQNIKGDKVRFSLDCELTRMNVHFIEGAHGRITIKIGSPNQAIKPVYLPLIVKQFEPPQVDPAIAAAHAEVGKKEAQYQQDLKDYYAEMRKVYDSRKAKDEGKEYQHLYGDGAMLGFEIFKLLEEDTENFENYLYSEEDRRERELDEKYKEALEWRGPLATGIVSQFNGFELRVYSDDHDKHFHVIHRGKGIDARFSFPDMQLLNYKGSKGTIGSKAEKKIREYCLQPEIFQKFEAEFAKRA